MDRARQESLLATAVRAARDGAVPILEGFRSADLSRDDKGDGSPVTRFDRAGEVAIRQRLRAEAPDIDVLGEEHGSEDTGSRYRFIVDPIDGTLSFISGIPLFGSLIGLEDREAERMILGVINLPALGELYEGGPDLGVRCGDEVLRIDGGAGADTSGESDFRSAIISAGDPLQFQRAGEMEAYRTLAERPLFRGYADCFGHALVLRGSVGAMVDPWLAPWDLAASRALVEGAGGTIFVKPCRDEGRFDVILGQPALVAQIAEQLGWT